MSMSLSDLARLKEGDEVEVAGYGGERRQLVIVKREYHFREDDDYEDMGPLTETTWLGRDPNQPGGRLVRFPVANIRRAVSWWH